MSIYFQPGTLAVHREGCLHLRQWWKQTAFKGA